MEAPPDYIPELKLPEFEMQVHELVSWKARGGLDSQ